MFRLFRKMLASILFSLIISFISFSSTCLCATPVDIQSPLVELLQNVVKSFQDLDYHTSKELVIEIPAVDQEIYFDLETQGSGDLFEPLPAIRGQLRSSQAQSGRLLGTDATTGDKFAELGKTIFKNELLKRSKDTEFMKWFLENAELSPLKLFVIKEVLLLIDSVKKQDLDQLKVETVCLLFRLSLTKDFGILNKEKPLTAQFPREVREALGPKFCVYIDDTWATIIRGMNNETIQDILNAQKKNAGAVVHSFVCMDETLAQDVFNHVKTYSGADFNKYVSKFVHDKNIELVDSKDFADVLSDNDQDALSNKLATFRTVGGISNQADIKDLPEEVQEEVRAKIAKISHFPVTITAKTTQGQHWVCYVTDRLGLLDTGRLGLAALVKALRQYAGKRQEYARTHADDIKKQRKAREGEAIRAQKINEFLRTDAGRASVQRITDAMAQLENPVNGVVGSAQNTQDLAKNLEKAQDELDELDTMLFEKQQEHDKLQKHLEAINWKDGGPKGAECFYGQFERYTQLKNVINDIELKLHDLQTKIIAKKAAIAKLKAQISRDKKPTQNNNTKLAELKKDLKELVMIEADQRRNNGKASQDVLDEIAGLKKEIEALDVYHAREDMLEDRIELRKKQATVYEQEAIVMNQELADKQKALENIKDLNKRRREHCKFTYMKNFYNLYVQDLNDKASKIKTDNALMVELKVWRAELHGKKMADIAKDDLERVSELEQKVGYLLDNKQYDGFLLTFINKRPELRDFFADSMNNKNAYHQELVDVLSIVARKSGHIQDNLLVYRDIVRVFLPTFLPIFDEATGFFNKTYGLA